MMNKLDLHIGVSKSYALFLLLLHVSCLYALWLANLPLWARLMLALLVGWSMIRAIRKALLSPRAIQHVQANADQWQLTLANNNVFEATLVGEVLVWSWLIVARFRHHNNYYSLVLLPDNCSPQAHRLSRVYFSYYVGPATEAIRPPDNSP
ncbi:MAG: hypothetical protein KUG79_06535 [Pseudomonadales bacterium]|nr:hypothetical protein [Pseudomonadales bacterium]